MVLDRRIAVLRKEIPPGVIGSSVNQEHDYFPQKREDGNHQGIVDKVKKIVFAERTVGNQELLVQRKDGNHGEQRIIEID